MSLGMTLFCVTLYLDINCHEEKHNSDNCFCHDTTQTITLPPRNTKRNKTTPRYCIFNVSTYTYGALQHNHNICSSPSLFFISRISAQIYIWTYDCSNLLSHEWRGLFLWHAAVKELSWPSLPSSDEIKQEWNCTSIPPCPLKVSTRSTRFGFCWTGRNGRLPLLKWKHQ